MNYKKLYGLKDAVSNKPINIIPPEDSLKNTVIVRVKVKSDVNVFIVPDTLSSYLIKTVTGVNETVLDGSVSSFNCGQEAIFFFSPGDGYNGGFVTIPGFELGEFLSQVDVLYNPLPWFFYFNEDFKDHDFNINYNSYVDWEYSGLENYYNELYSKPWAWAIINENFTTSDGIFNNPLQVIHGHGWGTAYDGEDNKKSPAYKSYSLFYGSTFKVAPRLYSDWALKQMTTFPVGYTTTRNEESFDSAPNTTSTLGYLNYSVSPFEGCENVTQIENQGAFGENLQILGPINFSVKDDFGFRVLSGYPSEGAPKFIDSYITVPGKVRFSTQFPVFDNSQLKVSYNHFNIDELVIDSGTPQFPFGGLTFKGSIMEALSLPRQKWSLDLPSAIPAKLNFNFSWGTLGIEAPSEVKHLHGLHLIFQTLTLLDSPTYVVTPERLNNGINNGWGSVLQNALNDGLDLTEDLMPKFPDNVNVLVSYYEKITSGKEHELYEVAKMDSANLTPYFNEEESFYSIPEITLHGDKPVLYNYLTNLYSDLVVDFDITLPKMPENVFFAKNCYTRTFYNTRGKPKPISFNIEPSVLMFFSVSGKTLYDASAYGVVNPHRLLPSSGNVQKYADFVNDFFNNSINIKIEERNMNLQDINGAGDVVSSLNFTSSSALLNYILNQPYPEVNLTTITSNIVLETGNYNNLAFLEDFQRECFYGASIDVTKVNPIIKINQLNGFTGDTGVDFDGNNIDIYKSEFRNYCGLLDISTGFNTRMPANFWTGEAVLNNEAEIGDEGATVRFLILRSFAAETQEELDKWVYNIDDILWEKTPRTETTSTVSGSKTVQPFKRVMSKNTIKGNYENFLNNNEIVLLNNETFESFSTSIDQLGIFTGPPLLFSAKLRENIDPSAPSSRNYYYSLRGSYSKYGSAGWGTPPNTSLKFGYDEDDPFWYENPLFVSGQMVSKSQPTVLDVSSPSGVENLQDYLTT